MRVEHWLYQLPLRLRSLFRRRQVELELDEELQYHLEKKTEEYIAKGFPARQARQAALRSMDGLTRQKEECRETWGIALFDQLVQDVRYGARVLAKSPGFTGVAVLTLALAIAANAVVFGILNALILRPLDVPRPQSLYAIQRGGWGYMSYPAYLDLRDRNRSFESLAGFNIDTAGLDTGDNPARVWLYEVTGNYFDTLGIQPYLGRFFHAADERGPNSAPYIVLTHAYWHTHFQDDAGVAGRVVRLNKHPYTILGVAPPEFYGTTLFFAPDFFVPLVNQQQMDGRFRLNDRGDNLVFQSFGHLKPGISPQQAIADVNSVRAALGKIYPKEAGGTNFSLAKPGLGGDFLERPARAFVTALMLLAGLILLAACANLGSLFAARAADRSREVALRLALGAARNRILRQLLTEAVMISLMGGAVGLWGSVMLLRGLSNVQLMPRFPMRVPVTPDANVYIVAIALAVASGILFGLVPVRQVLRTNAYQIVKAGSTVTVGRRITVRDLLLVAQVAICAVLVTSSLVAVRGLKRSLDAHFGFDPRNVMLAQTQLAMTGYSDEEVPLVQKRMLAAVQAIPGVQSAALVDNPPLSEGWNPALVFTGREADLRPANAIFEAIQYRVSPTYFEAAGTQLLAGRTISEHDDHAAPRVAIVNGVFARRTFGSVERALGSYFKLADGARLQVIGVAQDGRYTTNLAEKPQPAMFVPLLQAPANMTWLLVRSGRDPRQVAEGIRGAVRGVDRELPVFIETWYHGMDGALFATRVAAVALGILGMMGAMLAVTGVFAMAAYSVSKRLRELGIRLALGARRKEVLQAGLGRALKLLALGSAVGLALGILSAQVLAAIVYQATPRDPLVLAGVVLAMLLLGLLATWIPAQRALSLDPVTLLREE